MKSRWARVILVLWASIMPVLVVLTNAPAASAAKPTECHWVNADTISCDGTTYSKTTVGSDVRYVKAGDSQTFVHKISSDNTNGSYFQLSGVTGSDSPVALGNPENATGAAPPPGSSPAASPPPNSITCAWVDKNTITCGSTKYTSDSGAEPYLNGSNLDRIDSISGDHTTAKRTVISTVSQSQTVTNVTLTGADNATATPAAGAVDVADQTPTCDVAGLSWLVCPVIDALNKGVSTVEGWIKDVLVFNPLDDTAANASLKNVWAAFRDIANVAFVLVFMLVIFGQALGYDSYTIKKILPRLVAAAVLIQFSWTLMGLAVDVTNVLGQGVASMVSIIPGTETLHTDGGASHALLGVFEISATAIAGITIASATVGLAVFIPLILTLCGLLLTILLTFLTLELRILILQVLIVLAPVAILAWVLPNTQKVFKTWRTALTDLLLMYPIIMLIFLGGALFSLISHAAGDSTFNTLVGSLGPMIAFGLVPATVAGAHAALKFGSNAIAGAGINQAKRGLAGRSDDYKKRRTLDKQDSAAARLRSLQETGGPKTLGQHIQSRRAMNQVGLGFTSMNSQSAPVQARLAAAISKSDKAREDAALQRFSAQDPSASQLAQILTSGKAEEPEMRAAITRLANTGEYGTIAASRNQMRENIRQRYGISSDDLNYQGTDPTRLEQKKKAEGEINRRYTDMLGSNYSDIKAKSIIATDGSKGLETISSKHLLSQQKSTFEAYGQTLGTNAAAKARLETQLQTLQQSGNARSEWNASNGQALLNSLRASGQHAVAADYEQRFFESDGRLKAPVKGASQTATNVVATAFAGQGAAQAAGTSTAHSVVAPSAASGFGGSSAAAPAARPASPYGGTIQPPAATPGTVTPPSPTPSAPYAPPAPGRTSSPAPSPATPRPTPSSNPAGFTSQPTSSNPYGGSINIPASGGSYSAPPPSPAAGPRPTSGPTGFTSRPTGTNPYGGTINIPRPSAAAPTGRQSPRISERLVDPRVEGDSDNRLT